MLTVLAPGPLATVQDRGRVGWASIGVPRSGAADRPAAALANRLVGNRPSAAVLEVTAGGLRLRAERTVLVAVTGFAPGFAYLTGLPPELHVPRRATPRTRVPAGSVGLAGPFAGAYPRASPGGWQLVGRTDAVLFDVARNPPALLAPGARVRFRRAEC